jgi:hypothetical protein
MALALVGPDLAEGHKVNPVALEGLVEAVNLKNFLIKVIIFGGNLL